MNNESTDELSRSEESICSVCNSKCILSSKPCLSYDIISPKGDVENVCETCKGFFIGTNTKRRQRHRFRSSVLWSSLRGVSIFSKLQRSSAKVSRTSLLSSSRSFPSSPESQGSYSSSSSSDDETLFSYPMCLNSSSYLPNLKLESLSPGEALFLASETFEKSEDNTDFPCKPNPLTSIESYSELIFSEIIPQNDLINKVIAFHFGQIFSLGHKDLIDLTYLLSRKFRHFASCLPTFSSLHPNDQEVLLTQNSPLYFHFILSRYISAGDGLEQIKTLLGSSFIPKDLIHLNKFMTISFRYFSSTLLMFRDAHISEMYETMMRRYSREIIFETELNAMTEALVFHTDLNSFSHLKNPKNISNEHYRLLDKILIKGKSKSLITSYNSYYLPEILSKSTLLNMFNNLSQMSKFYAQHGNFNEVLSEENPFISLYSKYSVEEDLWLKRQLRLFDEKYRIFNLGHEFLHTLLKPYSSYSFSAFTHFLNVSSCRFKNILKLHSLSLTSQDSKFFSAIALLLLSINFDWKLLLGQEDEIYLCSKSLSESSFIPQVLTGILNESSRILYEQLSLSFEDIIKDYNLMKLLLFVLLCHKNPQSHQHQLQYLNILQNKLISTFGELEGENKAMQLNKLIVSLNILGDFLSAKTGDQKKE